MSNDLVKQLRNAAMKRDGFDAVYLAEPAANRIEELEAKGLANRVAIMRLEAKLAKAVGLIQFLDKEYQHVWGVTAKSKVRTTLAELKGEDRG